jgi:hypothetical protein
MAECLSLLFELPLSSATTASFVVASFVAGRLPPLESLCHWVFPQGISLYAIPKDMKKGAGLLLQPPFLCFFLCFFVKWARRDSNSYTFRCHILSVVRLPIPPFALRFGFLIIGHGAFFVNRCSSFLLTSCASHLWILRLGKAIAAPIKPDSPVYLPSDRFPLL